MTILIDPFPDDGFEASTTGGFTGAAGLAAGGAAFAVPGWAVTTALPLPTTGFADEDCATTGRLLLGVGFKTELTPMVRACVEEASLVAFSRICFCFSSSLARIGTKSSGMGLFSCTLSQYFKSTSY